MAIYDALMVASVTLWPTQISFNKLGLLSTSMGDWVTPKPSSQVAFKPAPGFFGSSPRFAPHQLRL
jgi:hypothetical protein